MAMLRPDPLDRPTAADCVELLAGGAVSRSPVQYFMPERQPVPAPGAAALPEPFTARSGPPARAATGRSIALTAVALALVAAAGGTAYAIAQGMGGGGGNPAAVGTGGTAGASPGSRPADAPRAASSPSSGIWIAQLGSILVSRGPAALHLELAQIRVEIPDARYLVSADYASLRPGYWVVYYAGSFTNGNQALAYCVAHGRTTKNQCVGRYLSHDVKDRSYVCLPPGGPQKALCYRP
jgi:hypothetical protein